ncbi:MAG: hypothetical protein WDA60_09825 [Acidimicrobiia bacterium]|jgi:nitroimidazol reductase NimA-like FMN-containing flavoprotein (pyridoxamine 5'-phosphate oxidase superfamily)
MGDRPDISMTTDEITAFLGTQRRVVVAALDGTAPVGTVAAVRLDGGELEVTLRTDDDVRALLASDDRVCVIAEQFPTYYEIKAVCAHGRARSVDGSGGRTFRVGLDDVTSFDFGKLPRKGDGSGAAR